MQRKTERKDKDTEREREKAIEIERRRGEKEIEADQRYRSAADVFCAAGLPLPCRVSEGMQRMQGRLSSGVVEANQHFGGILMDSTKNIYLHCDALAFFFLYCSELVKPLCVAIKIPPRSTIMQKRFLA